MASPDGSVDLRSDTVTMPTPEMRRAMADAAVGDDIYGEDPTINALQERAAGLLGMEAGLYVPTGSMANQVALRALAERGTVVCGARSHVATVEAEACVDADLGVDGLEDRAGRLDPGDIAAALARRAPDRPAVVTLENTFAAADGWPSPPEEIATVVAPARDAGIPVHVDGARIWNASVALGVPVRALVAPATTAMFCISKGLGAPVGSIVCGPAAVIAAAHGHRRRMGGAMRQAGVIAAAGLVALDAMIDRLADDHERARRLAERLAERFPGSVDPSGVRTNIVRADAQALPERFVERLGVGGVKALRLGPVVRFVTHHDVDDDDMARALAVLDSIARETHPVTAGRTPP